MSHGKDYLPIFAAIEAETGRTVHKATGYRWWKFGNARAGVKLQTWIVGGRRMTTREAVRQYVAACTEAIDK